MSGRGTDAITTIVRTAGPFGVSVAIIVWILTGGPEKIAAAFGSGQTAAVTAAGTVDPQAMSELRGYHANLAATTTKLSGAVETIASTQREQVKLMNEMVRLIDKVNDKIDADIAESRRWREGGRP